MKINKLAQISLLLTLIIIPNTLLSFYNKDEIVFKNTPPQSLVVTARNEGAFLQWNNQEVATNHLIEYKESSSDTWVTFSHPESSTEGILVNDLTNGVSYDFRVYSIMEGVQSEPSEAFSITPEEGPLFLSNNQIIATGQSNAMGTNAFPVLSTSQPFSNRMLSTDLNSLIPLSEPITNGIPYSGETMSSAFANTVTYLSMIDSIPNYSSIISLNAVPGVPYTTLMQGTPTYNSALAQVEIAKNISLNEGNTLIVPAVTTVHGESDEIEGTTADEYEDYLVEWQNNYETDIRMVTGQPDSVPLFLDQMSSWTSFGYETPRVAIGQYNAAKNNPDKIIMVTPRYIFDSVDNISHMTNYSQRRLGEYYAKVYKKVVIDNENWSPLMPNSITMSENIIDAEFNVPVPPLTFDTTNVLFKENYGFEYTDDSNSAYITNIQIISPDTIRVTLSNTPSGNNPRLRYAYTGTANSLTGRNIPGSARGNLRDSDNTLSMYPSSPFGLYLNNWALTFDEPVMEINLDLPNEPTEVLATQGNSIGTAYVSFTESLGTESNPIINYTVTSYPGNIISTGTSSPIIISGLTNHTMYTFTVTAVNQIGESTPSENSNSLMLDWSHLAKEPIVPRITPIIQIGNLERKPQKEDRIK